MCRIDGNLDACLYRSILEQELMDTLCWYNLEIHEIILQQDNDSNHPAKSTLELLHSKGITLLPFRPHSPDLNPIDHIWNKLELPVRNDEELPAYRFSLWSTLQQEWERIDPAFWSKLVNTMRDALLKYAGPMTATHAGKRSSNLKQKKRDQNCPNEFVNLVSVDIRRSLSYKIEVLILC